jgi:hypothetical protein
MLYFFERTLPPGESLIVSQVNASHSTLSDDSDDLIPAAQDFPGL